jgi:L,D-transpeptidase ErfK/SrfK
MIRSVLLFSVMLAVAPPAAGEVRLRGRVLEHVVEPGESLWSLGARHGVDPAVLARDNGLEPGAWLRIGQVLRIDARHLVPPGLDEGVLVNVPQRMLFLFSGGELREAFPVSVGRRAWPTPVGDFHVVSREVDKTWRVPLSVQAEMRREGREVLTEVPPGPDNPLGRHWLGISAGAYGIHGTIAPASIHHFLTHGCIRMHPDDVEVLFDALRVGDAVRIVYHPVLLAQLADGRVFLEAHPDAYRRAGDPMARARALARESGVSERVDWPLAEARLAAREGIAREVGRAAALSENETDSR